MVAAWRAVGSSGGGFCRRGMSEDEEDADPRQEEQELLQGLHKRVGTVGFASTISLVTKHLVLILSAIVET